MGIKFAKHVWEKGERAVFARLTSPEKIQRFLDSIPYNISARTHSPRYVLRHQAAHCFDGALFAAAALEFNSELPLLIDLRANHEDDDHILAIFKRAGLWGAIGKSNYTGCRYRDPIFRSIRELVMSYAPIYFNLAGKKTLREYSVIYDLRRVTKFDWRYSAEDLSELGDIIDSIRHYRLFPRSQERHLAVADDRSFRAETLGLDPRGAFKIKGAKIKA